MKSNLDNSPDSNPLARQSNFLIPPTEHCQFILIFALLTGMSLFIGLEFVNSAYNPFRGAITGGIGFEEGLIWGAVVGTAQWLSLRRYSFDKKWIIVTALGCAISMTLAYIFTFRLGVMDSSGNVFLALWLGFAAQSLALNHYVRRSWLWILISLPSAFIAALLWKILIPISPLTNDFSFYGIKLLVVKLSQGLILGVISGVALCRFHQRNS